MDHKILTESAAYYRKLARAYIGKGWISLAVTYAIYLLMISIVDIILMNFFSQNLVINFISFVYSVAIFGPAIVGLMTYGLTMVRQEDTPSPTLAFSGFENALRSFSLGFQMEVRILLWALLLVIPGIVAAYRYSMAPMLLIDRPDLSPTECIEESKRIMLGNKARLFWSQFSLIGWAILASIPMGIAMNFNHGQTWFTLIIVLCYIPVVFVLGYGTMIQTSFYKELMGTKVEFETEYV